MLIILLCLADSSTGAVPCKLARRVLHKGKEQDKDELGRGQKT